MMDSATNTYVFIVNRITWRRIVSGGKTNIVRFPYAHTHDRNGQGLFKSGTPPICRIRAISLLKFYAYVPKNILEDYTHV